ncbi:hypothetical protein M8J76_001950 [Diaphorina citri]|nr:hypothetical protein M8J76_001950 [Diaphorina citri]
MREIFDVSISKGGGSDICVSGQPGYLELTEDQKARLICTEPIEDHYEVEDEPFARVLGEPIISSLKHDLYPPNDLPLHVRHLVPNSDTRDFRVSSHAPQT